MDTMSLSTTTITTLIGVFLAVALFMLCRRHISSLFMSALAVIIIILAFEAATGYKLLDLGELLSFIVDILMRFFHWIERILLPELSNAVEDVAQNFNS